MKVPKLGDYLLWNGELAKIVSEAHANTVSIELLDSCKCPECGHDLGKKQFSVIPTSPLFQQSASALQTMVDK